MLSKYYPLAAIAIIAIVTCMLRFVPFLLFIGRKTPKAIEYLGRVLPGAIMTMLVVYCLRSTDICGTGHGIAELVSCVIIVVLQKWRKNTLLSIVTGTVCYMLLIRII
ncbi:MAG: AzlD domain-containing protein [Lachnospiraceae bacterium]|nr:AzlD domain-containing protein [Candidatus Colinaster equi]